MGFFQFGKISFPKSENPAVFKTMQYAAFMFRRSEAFGSQSPRMPSNEKHHATSKKKNFWHMFRPKIVVSGFYINPQKFKYIIVSIMFVIWNNQEF